MSNFRDFSENLADFTVENKEELGRILDNLDSFMANLAQEGPQITGNLSGMLAENRGNLRGSLEEIRDASADLNKAMDSLDSIAYKLDSGQGSVGRLINDEETIDSVNQALDGVNEFLNPVNRLKLDLGFQTEKLTQRDAYKSYISLKLRPVRDHYYTVRLVTNPDGKQTRTDQLIRDNSSDQVVSNQTTYASVDAYRISLLVTQRFYDTELHFGLMENTAGFGLDQYFGKQDQFRLNLKAFEFNRESEPTHLSAGGYWRFMQNFYLVGGVDDLLNQTLDRNGKPKKNPYIGIGVNFSEDYMKSLFGLTNSNVLTRP